jgi:membrane protein YqaA with SNARE-associated domain
MYLQILTIAGLATFEIYAAIPAGFALKLSPWVIFVSTVVGGLVGVYVSAFLGNTIKKIFRKKNAPVKEPKPRTGLVYRIWDKYGLVGLGFLGTMTVGAPISIAVGVGFKAPLKKLVAWCCLGVIARCAIFTTIAWYGLKLV